MASIVTIADLEFRSKKSLTEWCEQLLEQYRDGQPIPEPDHARLLALQKRHPYAAQKVGCGVSYFYVEKAPDSGRLRFCARRVDDSVAPWGWRKAVSGTAPTPTAMFRAAARWEVVPDITSYRDWWFSQFPPGLARCADTGALITPETCEVDHQGRWEFSDICSLFLKGYRLQPSQEWIEFRTDINRHVIADPMTRDRFINFHRCMAKLAVVHVDAHRRRTLSRFAGQCH